MSVDLNDFIIKQKRKYFKCFCDKCGKERGYFHKEKANLLCSSCGGKKSSITGWKTRGTRTQCSVVGCNSPHNAKGLCHNHYLQQYKQQKNLCKKNEHEKYLLSDEYKKILQQRKQRKEQYKREWYQSNKTKIQQNYAKKRLSINAKCQIRRKNINNRIAHNIRSRLSLAVKGKQKFGSAISDLGCSIAHLKIKLQLKFHRSPRGKHEYMTWDNYGEWHIDHKRPLASFDLSDPQQLKDACHYTNLQPMWAKDNLKKGSKDD